MTDTAWPLAGLEVQTADTQSRDSAVPLLKALRRRHPFVGLAYADSAYRGKRVANATGIILQIVRKLADQVGFVVHPRRWVIEWTFAHLGRNRPSVPRFRGNARLCNRLRLRRFSDAARQAHRSLHINFETDTQGTATFS